MSKLTSAQLTAYLNKGDFVKPVFHLYVIECAKTGGKYYTVRQNMSGEAFMRIVAMTVNNDADRSPLAWSVRRYGFNSHEIKRIATYTDKSEARIFAAGLIEKIASKGLSLNGGRARVGASDNWNWYSENEAKKLTAKSKNKPAKSAPVLEASA